MICVLCKKEFDGAGNNPEPLKRNKYPESRCCDECDDLKVTPARFVKLGMPKENARILGEAMLSLKKFSKQWLKHEEENRKKRT